MDDEQKSIQESKSFEHNNHQQIQPHQGRNIHYDYVQIHGAQQDLRKATTKAKQPVRFAHSLFHPSMCHKAPNIQDTPRLFQAVSPFSTRFSAFVSFQYSNKSHKKVVVL